MKSFKFLFPTHLLVFGLALSFLGNFTLTNAATPLFERNLQQGSVGEDVRSLQRILNQDRETQVVAFGLCSPGQESNYFNVLTKVAVIKFQEKYHAEVLDPIGLTEGTGYVGALTRRKLNSLVTMAEQGRQAVATTSFSVPQTLAASLPQPKIISISPLEGHNGSRITIAGSGFSTASNTVMTSFGIFDGIPSADGKTISFDFKSDVISSIEDPRSAEPDEVDTGFRSASAGSLPLSIMIKNANGFSAPTTTFKLLFK